MAPIYDRSNSLFGGLDESKRTSDATEYVGKLTYPASWVWSGAKLLANDVGDALPDFIGAAIELGLPSEAATRLVKEAGLTRPAALAITGVTGPSWRDAVNWLAGDIEGPIQSLGLTALDGERFAAFRERLLLSSD
jgi:hypothetical protein